MIEFRIPFCFTQKVGVKLTWADVLEGQNRCLLANDFARDKALEELTDDAASAILDLAVSDPSESGRDKIEELASSESLPPSIARLLYLSVAYLRKQETATSQLLDFVEELYADFDYPSCLAKAVRYMPMEDPDLGSREANERRLIANLDNYLATHPDSSAC